MGQGVSCVREKLPAFLGGKSSEGNHASSDGTSTGGQSPSRPSQPQFSLEEALALQNALKAGFAEESFQKLLRRAEALHPQRGRRGHADHQAFTLQLHGLLLHVYRSVLPKKPWCLAPGWEGYRQMLVRMASVSEDPKIIKVKEEINAVLGLPRHTVIRPPAEEPVVVDTPDGSGNLHVHEMPLLVDMDGDEAHEFWEEDPGGNLRPVSAARAVE